MNIISNLSTVKDSVKFWWVNENVKINIINPCSRSAKYIVKKKSQHHYLLGVAGCVFLVGSRKGKEI